MVKLRLPTIGWFTSIRLLDTYKMLRSFASEELLYELSLSNLIGHTGTADLDLRSDPCGFTLGSTQHVVNNHVRSGLTLQLTRVEAKRSAQIRIGSGWFLVGVSPDVPTFKVRIFTIDLNFFLSECYLKTV